MRSSRSFVASLLAAGLALMPLHAAAQAYAFVVIPSQKLPEKVVEIKVVENCKVSGSQLICTVATKETSYATPAGGAGTALGNLTYGVSRSSPTCVWFYDWTKGTRYQVCWP
jgi:hypothetical protein